MATKQIPWENIRDLSTEVTAGAWATWVSTARAPKEIELKQTEKELARSLGLASIPRDGVLSLGWCFQALTGGHHMSTGLNAAHAAAQAVVRLSGAGSPQNPQFPAVASRMFELIMHRESLRRWGQSVIYASNSSTNHTNMYDRGSWTPLNDASLTWLSMQSPLSSLDRPSDEYISRITTDPTGRLHNETGPAVVTTRNRTVHALRGVTMGSETWSLRGNAKLIMGLENVEQRRVLIEDMGTELFIQEAGLRPFHKDETGLLYRLESSSKNSWERDVTHLCWVHVTCPSTANQYLLAVPPTTRTAREGVAWTFQKLPEEYSPQKET